MLIRPSLLNKARVLDGVAYLYILHCEGFYKVGITRNLRTRISSCQSGNPFEVTLCSYRIIRQNQATAIEAEVHRTLDAHRVRGEWFLCELSAVKAAVKQALSIARRKPPRFMPSDDERAVITAQQERLRAEFEEYASAALRRQMAATRVESV